MTKKVQDIRTKIHVVLDNDQVLQARELQRLKRTDGISQIIREALSMYLPNELKRMKAIKK